MARLFLVLALVVTGCQSDPTEPTVSTPETPPAAAATAPVAKLNLNVASEEEFKALGIGDRMAHEFDEYRPYASIREFRQKIGKYIDDDADKLAEYEAMVFVPIDPNSSDAETLQQLPGVTAQAAQALTEARPFESDQAFLDAYLVAAPGGDVAEARAYLR